MFTISVETRFRASHQLALPDGSKEPIHHHDWLVTADLSSDRLDNMGVVMSFQKLRALMDSVVGDFDNAAIETVGYFQQNNPSAENVAKYIYDKLRMRLPDGVKLQNVRVVEEPGCSAKFGQ
ncbi:MAG: 6-carboxytetrahydropterin synthase [Phycisphaerales bacterium]|nr:MAG: 6-carboxytetrahydropterin synthase [Phycisphaerales bacterium]